MTKKNKKPKIQYDRDYKFEDRVNRVFDILRKTNVCTRDNLIKYSHFISIKNKMNTKNSVKN